MKRSNLGCNVRGKSPISSRKSVPPSAWLTRPNVLSLAPVNAPRLWPNSSLSINSAVSDGQLIVTQDFFARLLQPWMARASSPLPVPDRSEEHTSELQSLMRITYAVFCLKKKNNANSPTVHTCTHPRPRRSALGLTLMQLETETNA